MSRRVARTWLASLAAVIAGLSLASAGGPAHAQARPVVHRSAASHAALGLHVSGHHLVNSAGHTVRLLGFNTSGAEYACMEGWGIFDVDHGSNTAVPASYVAAMASWTGANAVRLSLNEQCWLGLAGVPAKLAGARYQKAIKTYVHQLNARGFAVILDLHNSAPGHESSLNQEPMPDAHSIRFWHQVGAAYKANTSVLFDVFNEPFPNNQSESTATWTCWRDGGCRQTSTNGGETYTAVGMNQLIHAVRSAGARNVVLAGGLNYASTLAEWLRDKPTDPDHELAASIHIYSFGGCHTLSCYRASPTTVARHVPLIVGEFGADLTDGMSCSTSDSGTTGFDKTFFGWADAHRLSYLAWTWNPWPGNCLDLVSNFAGAPTRPYGLRVRAHLRANRQSTRA
jgi:endoglucanase